MFESECAAALFSAMNPRHFCRSRIAAGKSISCALVALLTQFNSFAAAHDPTLGLPQTMSQGGGATRSAEISLGRRLFNDKALSADGSVSCSGCHRPEHAFSDGKRVGEGIAH